MSAAKHRTLDDPDTLRELVRRLKEGIYITTRDGKILDANPALLEMLGFSSLDELRARGVRNMLASGEERDRQDAILDRDGMVRDFELRLRTKDGQVKTFIDTCYSYPDPATGEVIYQGMLVDISERKELENKLMEQSIRDPLTGCFNRRYLDDFEKNMDACQGTWGCIVIDIDHFKDYNDRFGHQAGDEVLKKIARFLMRQVRAEEGVVRLGGDEFLVLLCGADGEVPEQMAKRIKSAAVIESPVSFSMGWAGRNGNEKLEKTIGRADHGLLAVRVDRRAPEKERRTRT